MYVGDRDQYTICAVATPHGVGGISVIRVSGPQALLFCRPLMSFLPEKLVSHKAHFGSLRDPETQEIIDEVLVTYFQEGHSFTGEEVAEISCHGSPFICQSILNLLIRSGCRAADRGEFTYRAFMNSKLDLVQAESVLSLIESQTQASSKLALRQLKGDLSTELEQIENDMTWILAHAEAGIDFSTEGIDIVDNAEVQRRLARTEGVLSELVSTFRMGRIIKDGFRVVLTGLPNVGKSSLLNLFLEDQRAIVTDIPGTTRDVLYGDTLFEGFKFTFLDTAGLRQETSDVVEKMGIERSYEAQSEADLVLFVLDSSLGVSAEEIRLLDQLDAKRTFLVFNKIDKIPVAQGSEALKQALQGSKFYQESLALGFAIESRFFFVSALDKAVRRQVLSELVKSFEMQRQTNSVLLSNARHFENLQRALENTQRSKQIVVAQTGDEFLALELKEALIAIQETLGKRFDDQIMDRVFKEFCIGK